MNKKNIIDTVEKKIKLSIEDKEILKAIEAAKVEWENAEHFFQLAKEPSMIDYAIYLQNAASVRYMHLLRMAKEKHINSQYNSCMRELDIR